MTTFAPAACSARTVWAPMRRAPPVINAVRPCNLFVLPSFMGADYDAAPRGLNASRTYVGDEIARGASPAGAVRDDSRRQRLDSLRRLPSHRPVRTRAWLLQRGQPQDWPGGRFHYRARTVSLVRALHGTTVRAGAGALRRRCSGTRCGQRCSRGDAVAVVARPQSIARTLSDPRGQRRPARASATATHALAG